MIPIACNCGKNRASAGRSSTTVQGTYRVMVNDRQVYESHDDKAAQEVADRFNRANEGKPGTAPVATILYPGQ